MESAAYFKLRRMHQNDEDFLAKVKYVDTFEVDSIELATPDLFSQNSENDSFNPRNSIKKKNHPYLKINHRK